jgi:hypothetical protein
MEAKRWNELTSEQVDFRLLLIHWCENEFLANSEWWAEGWHSSPAPSSIDESPLSGVSDVKLRIGSLVNHRFRPPLLGVIVDFMGHTYPHGSGAPGIRVFGVEWDNGLVDAVCEDELVLAKKPSGYQPQPPPPGSYTLPPGGGNIYGQQGVFDPAVLDNLKDFGWIGDYPTGPTTSEAEQWKKEGRCPQCGELGHFSHFAYVCSKHGTYT